MHPDSRRRGSPAGRVDEQKLFVGGIPHGFRDMQLRDAFRRFGATRATVMMDRKTGRSRGFGFVFVARDAADEALERMHGKALDGRKISVTKAVPEQHTMPGTPANLLASGRGFRGGAQGGRGSGRHGEQRESAEPWGGGRGRSRPDRYERSGKRERERPGPPQRGRSRHEGRSPTPRARRGASRDRSVSSSSRGADSPASGRMAGGSPASDTPAPSEDGASEARGRQASAAEVPRGGSDTEFVPPWEEAEKYLVQLNAGYDASGFEAYIKHLVPLDLAAWQKRIPPAHAHALPRYKQASPDGERPRRSKGSARGVLGVGGMRGTRSGPKGAGGRKRWQSIPDRYSREQR